MYFSKINIKSQVNKENMEAERKSMGESEIKKQILNLFKNIKINIGLLGCRYWITAAIKLIQDEQTGQYQKTTMGDFYKYAASKHKTTYFKAEKAMRYVVEEYQELIRQYFNITNYKIRNREFLQLICDAIN